MNRPVLLLTLGILAATAAHADGEAASAPTAVLPARTVTALKWPLTIPYQKAMDATEKVRVASAGRVDLIFRVADKTPATAAPLAISVEEGDKSFPIALDERSGFMLPAAIPVDPAHAVFVANRKKGELDVMVNIRPHVLGPDLSARTLRGYVQAGLSAHKSLVPWWVRVISPTLRGLQVCSRSRSEFSWDLDGNRTPIAAEPADDSDGRPAHCIKILESTDPTPDASVLVPPGDATYDFEGSFF